jgi:hypothetical protein
MAATATTLQARSPAARVSHLICGQHSAGAGRRRYRPVTSLPEEILALGSTTVTGPALRIALAKGSGEAEPQSSWIAFGALPGRGILALGDAENSGSTPDSALEHAMVMRPVATSAVKVRNRTAFRRSGRTGFRFGSVVWLPSSGRSRHESARRQVVARLTQPKSSGAR